MAKALASLSQVKLQVTSHRCQAGRVRQQTPDNKYHWSKQSQKVLCRADGKGAGLKLRDGTQMPGNLCEAKFSYNNIVVTKSCQ